MTTIERFVHLFKNIEFVHSYVIANIRNIFFAHLANFLAQKTLSNVVTVNSARDWAEKNLMKSESAIIWPPKIYNIYGLIIDWLFGESEQSLIFPRSTNQ